MQKELFSLFGNGRRENIAFTINAGVSVTCHFKASGTDDATNKYFDLRQPTHKVAITTNLAATITKINGIELKSPMTIPTGGLVFRDGIEWPKITIKADQDSTSLNVYAS